MFLRQHKYCTDTIEQFQKPFFIIIEFDLSDNDYALLPVHLWEIEPWPEDLEQRRSGKDNPR